MSLADIQGSIDDYLKSYAQLHVRKAQALMDPLHVPSRDPLPDFGEVAEFNPTRIPYEPQQHVIAAVVKMLDHIKGGFLVGEMGVGKTLLAMLSVHEHAKKHGKKGYRAIVMCPDSLIQKWAEQEIRTTIPGAKVVTFDSWRDVVKVHWEIGSHARNDKRWREPECPEFYIVGRDQSKLDPDWRSVGDPFRGQDGVEHSLVSSSQRIAGREDVLDYDGNPAIDAQGGRVSRPLIVRFYRCPSCGVQVKDKKGNLIDLPSCKDSTRCRGKFLRELPSPDKRDSGLDCWRHDQVDQFNAGYRKANPKTGKTYQVHECGEPLWQFTRKPNRWAPARFIHKHLKGAFDYCIVDEVHESKSDQSAQSMACGKLMASSKHVLAMTGTIIGGYAHHLFPLMMRIAPRKLVAEGMQWGAMMKFARRYGRLKRVVTTTQEDGCEISKSRRTTSMRRARSGKQSEGDPTIVPGVMPILFARHLSECVVFLSLSEMADRLPGFSEYCGCNPDIEDNLRDTSDPYWVNTCVRMEQPQHDEYKRVEGICDAVNKKLMKAGSMRFLGATLHALLEYPDRPWDWLPDFDGEHSVGYWLKPGVKTQENWVGVCTPADLDQSIVYPKEKKLVEIALNEKKHGNQLWVYVQMTGKRDIQPRLKSILESHGLKVGILRSKNVQPRARLEWLEKNGAKYDVCISHPKPVCLGMELFSKKAGGHNYNALCFYQPGYSCFVAEQAARRAWRLAQKKDCRVYWLYYEGTMEHRAVALMAKKEAANAAVDGEVSSEGLAAMAGDGDASLSLCRSISEQIDDGDLQRKLGKVGGSNVLAGVPVDGHPVSGLARHDLHADSSGFLPGFGGDDQYQKADREAQETLTFSDACDAEVDHVFDDDFADDFGVAPCDDPLDIPDDIMMWEWV
jgi:hypothetical protein